MGAYAELVKGDTRTKAHRVWSRWLRSAADLVNEFGQFEDDPFSYNETASVSLLAGAAAKSGYLGLADYCAAKSWNEDRRVRASGRCDFWLLGDGCSWAFEFKQVMTRSIGKRRLRSAMLKATSCARCVMRTEADYRVAGLITSLWNVPPERLPRVRQMLIEFGRERDYAWAIRSNGSGVNDTYLFFDLIQ